MDLTTTQWRKSSYSTGEGQSGDCVEVALTPQSVAVRDSKSPATGTLVLPTPAWAAFLARSH